jgi:hypothetical protein
MERVYMLLLQRGSMMTGTSAHATKLGAFSSLSLSRDFFFPFSASWLLLPFALSR